MFLNKFFRLQAPDAGDTGGGAGEVIDRGDDLFPETVVVKPDPAVEAATAAAAALEAELTKKVDHDHDDADPDADPAKSKAKDSRVPLARHEAILNKERERSASLAAQLAQHQSAQKVAVVSADLTAMETNVDKLDKEYDVLITDGELAKAAVVKAQIRVAERQMADARSDIRVQAAVAGATESARFNTALERVESAYPTLNPDHESYNADLDTSVSQLKTAYQGMGYTPTQALQAAVKALAGAETTRQEIATTTKPNVSDKDVAAERKKDAVAKTAAAIAKTPPSLSRTGLDSDKLGGGEDSAAAVIKMSQKEFAQLSDAALAKLRGDEM